MNLTNEQFSYGLPSWSGSSWSGDCGDYCSWQYLDGGGRQQLNAGWKEFYAWAVHPGDVASVSVPEPSTVWLMCIGLLGLWILGSPSQSHLRRLLMPAADR